MLQAFLKERRSWILFFLSLQLLILFVAYLDTTIPIASLFYIVLLSTFLMIVFLFFDIDKKRLIMRGSKNGMMTLNIKCG